MLGRVDVSMLDISRCSCFHDSPHFATMEVAPKAQSRESCEVTWAQFPRYESKSFRDMNQNPDPNRSKTSEWAMSEECVAGWGRRLQLQGFSRHPLRTCPILAVLVVDVLKVDIYHPRCAVRQDMYLLICLSFHLSLSLKKKIHMRFWNGFKAPFSPLKLPG